MNHHQAFAHGQPLTRGDAITLVGGKLFTFAYVADNGDIATQELGELPKLWPANRFYGVRVEMESKPAETEPLFIVRGRSIDGTVYYSGDGVRNHWASEKADALPVSHGTAEAIIKRRIERNRCVDLDSAIGRLEALPVESKPAESAETEKRHVGYIDMTPTWREIQSTLVMLIENGDSEGRRVALAELDRMATLADMASIILGAKRRPDAPTIPEAEAIRARIVPAGTRLKNGAIVLQRRPLPERPGAQSAEIVLCFLPDNDVTPFVTWQRNTGDESTYWGHYHGPDDLAAAVTDFQKR